MDIKPLQEKFERIGARVKLATGAVRFRRWPKQTRLRLDIVEDRRGEIFELRQPPLHDSDVSVVDVRPRDRHLLLLVREQNEKNKYLCGFDERHWFVAGIPESASVGNVQQAKDALQPAAVRLAVAARKLKGRSRHRRKNAAFRRQGEWFFIPANRLQVEPQLVLRNEPLSRGIGSKPHWADYCYRRLGEPVYVCTRHPQGLTPRHYRKLLAKNPKASRWSWRLMQRNPVVYVRGRIRHPDHATIMLHEWNRVLMNTEDQAKAMANIVFLD